MGYHPLHDGAQAPWTSYRAGAAEAPPAPSLCGAHHADIIVVGGGILGCSLALHAAASGARVVLLEAREIGWGASGRNSGHLPAASKHEPGAILESLGVERGQRLIDALASGPDLVFRLAEKYRIAAEADPTGTLNAAHTRMALARLAQRASYWQARGAPVEILDAVAASHVIGGGAYLGAYFDRRGGGINPLAYVRGLARAALDLGASLYERSRALRVERSGNKWQVNTDTGVATGEALVLCTNAYTDDLYPGLRQTIVPVRVYQFVTKPLSNRVRDSILLGRPVMTDTQRLLVGARIFADGRFQFNGIGPTLGAERSSKLAPALRRVAAIWPALATAEIEGWWSGWVAMNREDTWKIHALAPGLFAALGCNGRGIAIATLLGRDLAAHLQGARAEDLTFPPTAVRPIPLHAVHKLLVTGLLCYYKVRDRLEAGQGRSSRRTSR